MFSLIHFEIFPIQSSPRLGGALLKLEFEFEGKKTTEKLLVYRGGFLRFVQPAGAPGTVGQLEFWDGKGRVRHEWRAHGQEFAKDDTDMGKKLASWSAKCGARSGKNYNVSEGKGHAPPGWWRLSDGGGLTGVQLDQPSGTGDNKKISQGAYIRWKQDDESDSRNRYTNPYQYDASKPKDRAIGEPIGIGFKYNMVPIATRGPQPAFNGTEWDVKSMREAQNRNAIQIHPDGKRNGTAGCIGIQTYQDCITVRQILSNYHSIKLKFEVK